MESHKDVYCFHIRLVPSTARESQHRDVHDAVACTRRSRSSPHTVIWTRPMPRNSSTMRCAMPSAPNDLALDLTGVDFFGTAGFSALHTLNVRCAGAGVEWVLVPSNAVSRLMRICDPGFDVADRGDDARRRLSHASRRTAPATAAGLGAELGISRAAGTRASVRCRRARRSASGSATRRT